MRPPLIASLLIILLVSSSTPAQLTLGDIGVTGFWFATPTQPIWILHANGTSNSYPITGVTSTIQAIRYDPSNPNSFLIGGNGYLGRVTVTGGVATYASITTSVGFVTHISFDGTQLVVCDVGAGEILHVDPATGAIAPITSGPQPWGTDLNSACFDPNTGDIYAGALNAIWRIPSGSSTPVLFASGWDSASAVSGLAINPVSLEVVATLLHYNHFVRISAGGVLTNIATTGPSGPKSVDIDANGDFIVGASLGAVYRVPNAGGAPVSIGTPTGIIGAAAGVAVVIDQFHMIAQAPGLGSVSLALGGIPPGTIEGFTVASLDTSLPVGTGPIFGFSPDALSYALVLGSPTASPGNPIHWSWPVGNPNYPAVAFVAPNGTLAPNTVLDFIAVAINSGGHLSPTPVVRLTIN